MFLKLARKEAPPPKVIKIEKGYEITCFYICFPNRFDKDFVKDVGGVVKFMYLSLTFYLFYQAYPFDANKFVEIILITSSITIAPYILIPLTRSFLTWILDRFEVQFEDETVTVRSGNILFRIFGKKYRTDEISMFQAVPAIEMDVAYDQQKRYGPDFYIIMVTKAGFPHKIAKTSMSLGMNAAIVAVLNDTLELVRIEAALKPE